MFRSDRERLNSTTEGNALQREYGPVSVLCALAIMGSGLLSAAPVRAAAHHAIPVRCTKRNVATGTVSFPYWRFPGNLSPYRYSGEDFVLLPAMFDDLFDWDKNGKLVPVMASQNPDSRQWRSAGRGKNRNHSSSSRPSLVKRLADHFGKHQIWLEGGQAACQRAELPRDLQRHSWR